MSSTGNPQGFPAINVPIAQNQSLAITSPWYYLLRTLWARTGAASGSAISPTGMMMAYGSATLPTGWLLCNGQAISRVIYAALYSVIGETWGAGDGSTTFNVPDFRNRFLIGSGDAAFGTRGGSNSFTLSVANLPSHTHTITDPGHTHTTWDEDSIGTTGTDDGAITTGGTTGSSTTGITINATGGGEAVNFLPPYAAIVWGIKT